MSGSVDDVMALGGTPAPFAPMAPLSTVIGEGEDDEDETAKGSEMTQVSYSFRL